MSDNLDTYRQEYFLPEQAQILEDFEQMIWDETLRRAHAEGKVPVGSIMITTEPGPRVFPSQLTSDYRIVPMVGNTTRVVSLEQAVLDAAGQQPTIKVTAEVMVGVSL